MTVSWNIGESVSRQTGRIEDKRLLSVSSLFVRRRRRGSRSTGWRSAATTTVV